MSENPEIETPAPAPSKRSPVLAIVGGGLLLAGLFYVGRSVIYNAGHAGTDDAYVTFDVVPINARINGQIDQIKVDDNVRVKAGDLLVHIDDADYKAAYDASLASFAAAQAANGSASTDIGLTKGTVSAQLTQAAGGVGVSDSDVLTAQSGVAKSQADYSAARAGLSSSYAQLEAARDNVKIASAMATKLHDDARAAEASLVAGRNAVQVAEAAVRSAVATTAQAKKDADRAESLAEAGALSRADAEAKATALLTAKASEDEARQSLQATKAGVARLAASLDSANADAARADAAVQQAKSQVKIAQSAIGTEQAGVSQAEAGVAAARSGVKAADARRTEAVGKLAETRASTAKSRQSEFGAKSSRAKALQAKAELETAELNLDRTKIIAPVAGTVSRRISQLGQQVAPGETLMFIIPDQAPWIIANFKETQMGKVKVGQTVDIEVDAVSGLHLTGKVDSLSKGTGATFALLPPDNATGNFTKVVQRVPVKITLTPGQKGIERLQAGLSCTVSIDTRD